MAVHPGLPVSSSIHFFILPANAVLFIKSLFFCNNEKEHHYHYHCTRGRVAVSVQPGECFCIPYTPAGRAGNIFFSSFFIVLLFFPFRFLFQFIPRSCIICAQTLWALYSYCSYSFCICVVAQAI